MFAFLLFFSALMPGIDGFLLQVMACRGAENGIFMDKSRYGTAAGEWLMRLKVPRRLRAWSRQATVHEREKRTAAKGEMSAMIPFKQLFSLQVVVKVAIPSTGSSKAQETGASLDPQSAVGHFHVSEEKGNAVSSLSRRHWLLRPAAERRKVPRRYFPMLPRALWSGIWNKEGSGKMASRAAFRRDCRPGLVDGAPWSARVLCWGQKVFFFPGGKRKGTLGVLGDGVCSMQMKLVVSWDFDV